MRVDSREPLIVEVSGNVVLASQTVEIAVTFRGATPVWNTATWMGVAGTTRRAYVMVGPGGPGSIGVFTAGNYERLVRVDLGLPGPIPVLHAGMITFVTQGASA